MYKALIFTNNVLPATQTFIQAQTRHLQRYATQHIGLAPYTPSLTVEPAAILLTKDRSRTARLQKELYKWTGIAPDFHAAARRAGASVLHAHFAEDAALALSLQTETSLPMIVTLHGGLETQPDAALRRQPRGLEFLAKRARLQKQTAIFLCVSEFVRRKALTSGFPVEKCKVHYIGADLQFFSRSVLTREREVVLFVGRLIEKKGVVNLLRAMGKVQAIRPQARLILLGDGPLMASLRSLQRELGVRCEFHGSQPVAVVKEWMQRCRVVCAPSVTSGNGLSEGLPTVLVEALAVGTPVVSTWHAGIPEVVTHGVTGSLVAENDPEALAEEILTYLENDTEWKRASESARIAVQQSFDIRKQNEALESIYDGVRIFGSC